MKNKYLEITYRKGKMIAAYLYLPRKVGEKCQKTEKFSEGILIDYGKAKNPIGIEILDPQKINFEKIKDVITKLKDFSIHETDFAPLLYV